MKPVARSLTFASVGLGLLSSAACSAASPEAPLNSPTKPPTLEVCMMSEWPVDSVLEKGTEDVLLLDHGSNVARQIDVTVIARTNVSIDFQTSETPIYPALIKTTEGVTILLAQSCTTKQPNTFSLSPSLIASFPKDLMPEEPALSSATLTPRPSPSAAISNPAR